MREIQTKFHGWITTFYKSKPKLGRNGVELALNRSNHQAHSLKTFVCEPNVQLTFQRTTFGTVFSFGSTELSELTNAFLNDIFIG